MMNIDKQRIAAVRTLEALGYTWECGAHWKPPLWRSTARQTPSDVELLCDQLCSIVLDETQANRKYDRIVAICRQIRDRSEVIF